MSLGFALSTNNNFNSTSIDQSSIFSDTYPRAVKIFVKNEKATVSCDIITAHYTYQNKTKQHHKVYLHKAISFYADLGTNVSITSFEDGGDSIGSKIVDLQWNYAIAFGNAHGGLDSDYVHWDSRPRPLTPAINLPINTLNPAITTLSPADTNASFGLLFRNYTHYNVYATYNKYDFQTKKISTVTDEFPYLHSPTDIPTVYFLSVEKNDIIKFHFKDAKKMMFLNNEDADGTWHHVDVLRNNTGKFNYVNLW